MCCQSLSSGYLVDSQPVLEKSLYTSSYLNVTLSCIPELGLEARNVPVRLDPFGDSDAFDLDFRWLYFRHMTKSDISGIFVQN